MADKRFLRTALLTSERWNALTDDAQNLYVRLLLIVDDFGCFDARPAVIQTRAYYLGRSTPVPLDALHQAAMIVRYMNAGKMFLAITNWGENLRGRRLFPAPPVNVDIDGLAYRGMYGKPIGWLNPKGYDDTSVLLDLNLRPATPQPREWRDARREWEPLGAHTTNVQPMPKPEVRRGGVHEVVHGVVPVTVDGDGVVHGVVPRVVPRASVVPEVLPPSPSPSHSPSPTQLPSPLPSPGNTAGTQSLSTATPTTTAANGKIHLNSNGAWEGLSEAQRLKWQEMWSDLSIPDQLDRAAQWLLAHPDERKAYDAQPEGMYAYIVRWLLRESRAVTH